MSEKKYLAKPVKVDNQNNLKVVFGGKSAEIDINNIEKYLVKENKEMEEN